jgi:hypothetical protein
LPALAARVTRVLYQQPACGALAPGVSQALARPTKRRARENLVVDVLVEPRALDVEEGKVRNAHGERECIHDELGERFVGARAGLVVEDMHGAVAHLQEIEVPGERAREMRRGVERRDFRDKLDAALTAHA